MHPTGEPSDPRPLAGPGGAAHSPPDAGSDGSDAMPAAGTPAAATPRPTAEARRRDAIVAWLARQQRPVHERDLGIGRAIGGIRREVSSKRRRLGTLIDPWERLVPDEIKQRARVDGLRGDTLMVTVDSPATSWQLDRLLRGGLTQSFARASSDRIRRIRIRVGSLDGASEPTSRR